MKNDLNVLISAMAGISDLQIGHYAYLLLSGGGSEFKEKKKKKLPEISKLFWGRKQLHENPHEKKEQFY